MTLAVEGLKIGDIMSTVIFSLKCSWMKWMPFRIEWLSFFAIFPERYSAIL